MSEVHDGASLRAALLEIAGDFSFTWIAETRLLFDELEPRRFAALHHNPTALLSELTDDDPALGLADDDRNLVPGHRAVWRARVGRTSLDLSDTHVEGNPEWAVTDTLYGGNRENRLRQEVLLGVGGVRVLRRLGLEPTVFHLNEGHSAFLQLERMRELVEEQGLSAAEASERLRASTV